MTISVLLTGAVIANATVAPLLWIGPAPLWLFLCGLGLAIIFTYRPLQLAIKQVAAQITSPVLLPWIAFVVIGLVIGSFRGDDISRLSRAAFLPAFQCFSILVVATLAIYVSPRRLIQLLAVVAAVQGVICIAQLLQVRAAWHIPEIIASFSTNQVDTDNDVVAGANELGAVLRARGTFLNVHAFNPMQGMLAAALLYWSFLDGQTKKALRVAPWLLYLGATLGSIGVLLTFSRSTWIGLAVLLAFLIWRARKRIGTFGIVFLACLLAVAVILTAAEMPIIRRLMDFSSRSTTNADRIGQYGYVLQVLFTNPFTGSPYHARLPVHSVLLRQFVDFGLFGWLAYVLVLIGLSGMFLRFARSKDSVLSALGGAGLSGFLVVLLDSWTHSAGLLRGDVFQFMILGTFLGLMLGREYRLRTSLAAAAKPPALTAQNPNPG